MAVGDGVLGQPVDDDFQHAAEIIVERGRDLAAQGRAKSVVGRGVQNFVARADFRARAHDAAGEGQDRAFHLVHRFYCGLGGAQRQFIIGAADQRRLPPPTAALVMPVVASQRNSPSMTGMRQKCRPPNFFEICQPSPK